ncbi:MAG: hypothetical protein HQL69_12220 [Magnetococcales bacterium]|nr:hypothetical protein [Magnetococcales bacterium]
MGTQMKSVAVSSFVETTNKIATLFHLSRIMLGQEALCKILQATNLSTGLIENPTQRESSTLTIHSIDLAIDLINNGFNDTHGICAALFHDIIERNPAHVRELARKIYLFDKEVFQISKSLYDIRNLQPCDNDLSNLNSEIHRATRGDTSAFIVKIFDVLAHSFPKDFDTYSADEALNRAKHATLYIRYAILLGMTEVADSIVNKILPYLMPTTALHIQNTLEQWGSDFEPHLSQLARHLYTLVNGVADVAIQKNTLASYFEIGTELTSWHTTRVGWPICTIQIVLQYNQDSAWVILGKIQQQFKLANHNITDNLNADLNSSLYGPRHPSWKPILKALETRIIWDGKPICISIVHKDALATYKRGILVNYVREQPLKE